jgi:hypothetical protein
MRIFAALGISFLGLPAYAEPVALLRVDADAATYIAKVESDPAVGYKLSIDCVDKCAHPVSYRENVSELPMGLFVRDQSSLLFSLWSGGSTYRVRVWEVTDAGVHRIIELSSRERPEFLSDRQGRTVIHTFEGESGVGTHTLTSWIYINGRFVRYHAGRGEK